MSPRRMPPAGKPAELKAIGRMAMLDRVYVLELDEQGDDQLVEYADQAGRPFLFAHVDRDETANRWLMFRVGRADLEAFRAGILPRRALWERAHGPFEVVDLDDKCRVVCLVTVPLAELLPQYLPVEGLLFRSELSPDGWEAFREEAIEEARRRREANEVKAQLGPLGRALLDALHAEPEGLSERSLAETPWPGEASLLGVEHCLMELYDRHLIHCAARSDNRAGFRGKERPIGALGLVVAHLLPAVAARHETETFWHWGKHPDAIARELHRRADEGA